MTTVSLLPGDNRISLQAMIERGEQVDSVVTDPPYGLKSVVNRMGSKNAAPVQFGNDGAFKRLSAGFMGKCFHPDTEILTKGLGWVNIQKVSQGELVATLDPQTRQLVWQGVEQTHRYHFDGELDYIKHRSAEQLITPNHQMLVSHDKGETYELMVPSRVKSQFHLTAQSNPVAGKFDNVVIASSRLYGKDCDEVREEEQEFDAASFFEFFGLWLGDGYTVCRKNDHPANDFFGINVKKARKVIAVRNALDRLSVRYTETTSEDGFVAFYVYNFALLGFLKRFGGAKGKYIPTNFFEWDSSLLEYLYRGLIETDGTRQGKNQEVFFTSSGRLADDFQRLCLFTGRSCAIKMKPGGKKVVIQGHETISSDSWVCCVLQPGKRMYGEKKPNGTSNVFFKVPFRGHVHCVGVPHHHVLYTRFNGKPVWTGNSWDGTGIERDPEFWRLIWEVLKPGGFVFAFSGSRTGHWQACAMEMAGFIMHPMHGHIYHSGMPKAHDAAKAIDRHFGVKGSINGTGQLEEYTPASDERIRWNGWKNGTASQKTALEPIYLGQKPFSEKTCAANLLKHGVGAVNVDGCRVPSSDRVNELGRYPSNVILDGSPEVLTMFANDSHRFYHQFPPDMDPIICNPKAGKLDRAGSKHPTVKPIALMQYLIRHITPKGGTVLDPFAGSGTTAEAAKRENVNCILMEAEPEYVDFLNERLFQRPKVDLSDLYLSDKELKELHDEL